MTPTPSAPPSRPRSVTVAFWLWLVSVVVMVFDGLFVLTFDYQVPAIFPRVSGGILIVTGVALGYLAGKTRQGDWRFARATVALSLALVVFLSFMLVTKTLGLILAPVVVFLIIAAGLVMRTATASAWFAAHGAGDSQGV